MHVSISAIQARPPLIGPSARRQTGWHNVEYCTPKVLYTYTVLVLACTYGTAWLYVKSNVQLQQKLLSTIEMKMVIAQPPPHHQQKQRDQHQAETPGN